MKTHPIIKYSFKVIFLLISHVLSGQSNNKNVEIDFYSVVVSENNEVMIADSLKTGTKVNLVYFKNKILKEVITKKNELFSGYIGEYDVDVYDRKVTIVDSIADGCNIYPDIVIKGEISNFKWLYPEIIDNNKEIKRLLSNFNINDLKKDFIFEEFSYFDKILGDPIVKMIKNDNDILYIVTYKLKIYSGVVDGPSFLIQKGKIHTINKPCSLNFHPFSLNNNIYIYTGSSCCDCGWTYDFLLKVNDNNIDYVDLINNIFE